MVVIISAALLLVVVISVWKARQNTPPGVNGITPQKPHQIEGDQVPDGWYTHKTYGIDHEITVLSRTKALPNGSATEQIAISDMDTSLSPEDFIPRQGFVGGSLDSSNAEWSWGIYHGHKTFSMTIVANDVAQWFVYLFGGDTVYEFILSPNDQNNPNLAQDRTDFWKVITYYAQDPSFGRLTREETLQNCKTITLPEDKAYSVQAEPETGYVVVNFTQGGKRKYAFFNYNDDLSQCASDIEQLLSNTKNKMDRVQFSAE